MTTETQNQTVPLQDVLDILNDIANVALANETAWQIRSGSNAQLAQRGFDRIRNLCEDAALNFANPVKED